MFTAIFSIGIAIGSVTINRLLKSEVSARFAPASVIAMGAFVLLFYFVALSWRRHGTDITTLSNFVSHPSAGLMIVALLGVSITGGMFVVPLYAFLTTTVPKSETARTVGRQQHRQSAARWSSACCCRIGLGCLGVGPAHQLLLVAAMCLVVSLAGVEAAPRLRLSSRRGRSRRTRNPAKKVVANNFTSVADRSAAMA